MFEVINAVLEQLTESPISIAELTATDGVLEAIHVADRVNINSLSELIPIDMDASIVEASIEEVPPPPPPISDWNWKGVAAIGGLTGLVALNIYAACTYKGTDIPPSI